MVALPNKEGTMGSGFSLKSLGNRLMIVDRDLVYHETITRPSKDSLGLRV